jgi:N-acetylmuramoyl-L-alanine amidase
MKYLITVSLLLFHISAPGAEVLLNVVYPEAGQQLPTVDSTFIFGNVSLGAKLYINDLEVPVHKGGGWLAYLPVEHGEFVFNLTAVLDNDTSFLEIPVQIGLSEPDGFYTVPVIPFSPYPITDVVYSVGDVFEFSFKAPPGYRGWFRIDNSDSIEMLPERAPEKIYPSNVFGESSAKESVSAYITYSGSYRLTAADTGLHSIFYGCEKTGDVTYDMKDRIETFYVADSVLTVLPEFPPVIGVLSGRSQIIRTGPRLGYKLLYQPAGVKVHITGAGSEYYKIRLAESITGYTNIDSVTQLPPGTAIPEGRISFISVDKIDGGIEISAQIGEKLPYEIKESLSPPEIAVDIFGATGDVDWIRYNTHQEFLKLVKWSQPADGVFRISAEFEKAGIAGYQPYYDGNRFVIRIKKKWKSNPSFSSPIRNLKIVIDPGHSHDSGAVGPTGLKEKDANLWIAHELRLMLEKKGADVMMTRYGHENIALYDRPKMAEKWEADLLISVHNNALPDGINPFYNNGISVYYYHPHSKLLAEAIHKHLLKETGLPDHGLYYGNLVLTRPSSMPAVLVECAFMMIPEQEALLKTDKFQRKCARAILRGIEEYLRQ